ncbi:hypothetical protein [Paraherbaspirillum soli]|uniref:Uncharacterized protein n=1 Tax=Paraherbaspirillum soli TaxID=631222 RepID=A0ABW0MA06_9BURK
MDLVEKFDAKGASGTGYHVEGYQNPIDASTLSDATSPLPGEKIYRLLDGRPLKPISDKKFVIIQTGEEIHRI